MREHIRHVCHLCKVLSGMSIIEGMLTFVVCDVYFVDYVVFLLELSNV